jgi:SAM-dependent methyltransferase
MSTAEAIVRLRADPEHADLIRDAYLGDDNREESSRFGRSAEFQETVTVVGGFAGREVLDLGAGTGITSLAIANAGAARVYAVDPDPSPIVGRGAIEALGDDRIEVLDGVGEAIPMPDGSIDVLYGRQVLHHVTDLDAVAREAVRVLRPGGVFHCCREHVVADDEELRAFLQWHPVHNLAGGENAYTLDTYLGAIKRSGLRLRHVWGPWDTVTNAFPGVRSAEELKEARRRILGAPLAATWGIASRLPGTARLIRARLAPHTHAGAMYTFVAVRPIG